MRWTNKSHENDSWALGIQEAINSKGKRFAIFGAGKIGGEILPYVEEVGQVECYIDNNAKDYSNGYQGKRVLQLEQFLNQAIGGIVIIAVTHKNIPIISKQLNTAGLTLNTDYFTYTDFIRNVAPVYMSYTSNKAFMELAQICITERCTLRCRNCAHGCYAVPKDADDMNFDEVKRNADALFGVVDYIYEFVIIGGEPLLNQNIADCLEYIGSNYRNRMNVFSITTNGTIIPEEVVLEKCKKYNVVFRISNYSVSIPKLRGQYERIMKILEKQGIGYYLQQENGEWFDYGFDYVDDKLSEDELIERFDKCGTPCRDIHDQKLYYCVMARSVSDNLHYGIGKDDCLDLATLPEKDRSKVLLEYNMGYSEKGYLEMCARCHGADAVNYIIPAAEQVRR